MRKMSETDFNDLVAFFDQMAQTKWLSGIHDTLKRHTGTWCGKSILDVGCGTGRILQRGMNEARSLTGIDLSPEMIKAARSLLGDQADLFVGDACELPFEAVSFDLSLSTCVMFLLPEPEKGIAEMARVTKSGGMIAMLNPSQDMGIETAESYAERYQMNGFEKEALMKWSNVSTRRHRYEPDALSSILSKHGFGDMEHYKVLDGLALVTVGHKTK